MPETSRALTRATRVRAAATGEPYTRVRERLLWIEQLLADGVCETREDAEGYVADPANQVMCRTCGWTWRMVCPECVKGCGCSIGCSGWRHEQTGEVRDDVDDDGCPECGAGGGPYEECVCG